MFPSHTRRITPHRILPPPPNFTVGIVHSGRRRTLGGRHIHTLSELWFVAERNFFHCSTSTVAVICTTLADHRFWTLWSLSIGRYHVHDSWTDDVFYGWYSSKQRCWMLFVTHRLCGHRFDTLLLNLSSQQPPVFNSLFCESESAKVGGQSSSHHPSLICQLLKPLLISGTTTRCIWHV